MKSNSELKKNPTRWDLVILLLAIAGGSVDAVIILGFNILAGAQTGNSVLLGAAIAQGQLATALGSSISVLGFFIGAAVAEFIILRHRDTWRWPSALDTVLIAELMLLACLLILWHQAGPHAGQEMPYILIFCAASAMGMQSSAMLSFHHTPTTTYITGTLTTFATELIRWLRLAEEASDSSPEPHHLIMKGLAIDIPWLYGLTWFVYVAGTVVGGLLFLYIREIALMLPIIAIAVAAIAGHSVNKQHVNVELKQGLAGQSEPKGEYGRVHRL